MMLLEAFYRPSSSPNTVSEIYFLQIWSWHRIIAIHSMSEKILILPGHCYPKLDLNVQLAFSVLKALRSEMETIALENH